MCACVMLMACVVVSTKWLAVPAYAPASATRVLPHETHSQGASRRSHGGLYYIHLRRFRIWQFEIVFGISRRRGVGPSDTRLAHRDI